MTLLSIPNYTDFIIVHLLLKTEISESGLDRYFEFFNTFPQGNMENSFKNVMYLHRAGVDILVGTDVARVPVQNPGGLAHGLSGHHEIQLLVKAGFTPIEALQSATSKPTRCFGLHDTCC
ncbi:hypothetical protein QF041_000844 [Paenibacillus sp. W2I17]|nr:hypothetical protein [Paenibacillus sp. W2I17]